MRTMPQDASISANSSDGHIELAAAYEHQDGCSEVHTAKTNPGATMEGHESPSNVFKIWTLPPLWAKLICVIAIQSSVTVHVVYGIAYTGSTADEHGTLSIGTASDRQ